MKITRIVIGDYHQFGYLNIDLTYPKGHSKEGQPLDKVCLIGKNGTGKTTLLNILKDVLNGFTAWDINSLTYLMSNRSENKAQFCIEITVDGKEYLVGKFIQHLDKGRTKRTGRLDVCNDFYKSIPNFFEEIFQKKNANIVEQVFNNSDIMLSDMESVMSFELGESIKKGLLIYSPTEYGNNQSKQEPYSLTNLNDGLEFGANLPYYHEVSFTNLKNFWSLLIYQVQRREREREEYEKLPDNRKRIKEELILEFEKQYPEILTIIAEKWKVILDEIGLFFDAENVRRPIVLTDQLIAFIKDKKNKKNIPYGALSSGIKNLIFTVGYMTSLYFHRSVESATAIFDEPEFSLFPDLLLKLVDIYTDPVDFPKTQFFFATHSPLIASQFEPEERVCLHFDEDRNVTYGRGIAPKGDDPKDLLLKDFALEEVMPMYGVNKWKEYQNLKREIDKEKNADKIKDILKKYAGLRQEYNFPAL